MRLPGRLCLLFGLIGLVAQVGCSGGGNGSLATVSGAVTQGGSPVEGAKIIFHSTTEVEGGKQPSYSVMTDSSGKYLLATNGKDPGVPPGLYKVTITKLEGKGGAAAQPGMDAGQMEAMASDQGPGAKGGPVNLLPKEYATLATTKLSATLQQGKNENVNFDLKGK